MPYKNIHWVKLEKRLLNDHRFYTMTEESQLIYVKLLMLAAETSNKVPKNTSILRAALRSTQTEVKIGECMNEIKEHFPKFRETKDYYKFNGWGVRHNWVLSKESLGNSQGTAREPLDKIRIDKIRIEYIRAKKWESIPFVSGDYARMNKGIKQLIERADGKDEVVIEGIRWISEKNYEWTLETLLKKFPDFLKNRPSDAYRKAQEYVDATK